MITVLRTYAAGAIAAIIDFFTNWRFSSLWVHPYVERVRPIGVYPITGTKLTNIED